MAVPAAPARGHFDMAPLLPRLALLPRVRAPRSLWPWPHQFALGDSLILDQELAITRRLR